MTIEQRLAILEKEMAELKQGLAQTQHKPNWIERVKGSFKGDADFGEILRLGKEIRQATKSDW
jgi:hypothetical protein